MRQVQAGKHVYEIEFNLYTMEQIEKEYGGTRDLFQALQDGKAESKVLRDIFRMMVNTAHELRGEPEDCTGNEIRHLRMPEVRKLMDAIRDEINSGMKSETTGGNEADDDKHDAWLEEDEKNA